MFRPSAPPEGSYSLEEAANAVGLEPDLIERVYAAMASVCFGSTRFPRTTWRC